MTENDLVHHPEFFESKSWLVIGQFVPMAVELEARPKSSTKPATEFPEAKMIQVIPAKRGRTGKRPLLIYPSLRAAMDEHGRWVRAAVEKGTRTAHGIAKIVRAQG